MGHFKRAGSPNHPLGRVRTRPGSNRYEIVGPSKGPGRKNKALAKDSSLPAINELLLVSRGDKGIFVFLAGGPEEVATTRHQFSGRGWIAHIGARDDGGVTIFES